MGGTTPPDSRHENAHHFSSFYRTRSSVSSFGQRAVSESAAGRWLSGRQHGQGQAALLSLTTGGFNTGVGFLSLRSNTEGQFNTGIGAGTLLANTAHQNTATGVRRTVEQHDRRQK